jgi:hypothetical protein
MIRVDLLPETPDDDVESLDSGIALHTYIA